MNVVTSSRTPDWSPFSLAAPGERAEPIRGIITHEGIADRLRTAAFAELQAREAFRWAAHALDDAPPSLKLAWLGLAAAEDLHLGWLLKRMKELNIDVAARKVSDYLWLSLRSSQTAREFALFMASAEDRGRQAGERFHQAMISMDPISAELFGKIAAEEVEHIRLAQRYFPGEKVLPPPHAR